MQPFAHFLFASLTCNRCFASPPLQKSALLQNIYRNPVCFMSCKSTLGVALIRGLKSPRSSGRATRRRRLKGG
jgi:hypothetical protein